MELIEIVEQVQVSLILVFILPSSIKCDNQELRLPNISKSIYITTLEVIMKQSESLCRFLKHYNPFLGSHGTAPTCTNLNWS